MKIGSLPSATDKILLKITAVAWLLAKIISFKLWTCDRFFPVITTFEFLEFSNGVHISLYVISQLALLSLLFFPNKKIVAVVILAELIACILDQMRWQPWQYQYLLTFLFYFFSKDKRQFLSLIVFLFGATYFFSGLHKFSGSFLFTFWDKLILHKTLGLSWSAIKNPILHYAGLVICVMEIAIGVGLLFFRNKNMFWILAICMHLFIILLFGPTGYNYNNIIFPWNLAMIFMAVLLFARTESQTFNLKFFGNKINFVALILVGLLPFLSFIEQWDNYLSFNLYSGNTKVLIICSNDFNKYPELRQHVLEAMNSNFCKDSYYINTNKWALDELKVPVVPEVRVYRKMQAAFGKIYPTVENEFLYYQYPYKKQNITILP